MKYLVYSRRPPRLSEIRAVENERGMLIPSTFLDFLKFDNGGQTKHSLLYTLSGGEVRVEYFFPLCRDVSINIEEMTKAYRAPAPMLAIGGTVDNSVMFLDMTTGQILLRHGARQTVLRYGFWRALSYYGLKYTEIIAEDIEALMETMHGGVRYEDPGLAAVASGDFRHLRMFLRNGGDINHKYDGVSLVLFVAIAGDMDMLKECIASGADVRNLKADLMMHKTPNRIRQLKTLGFKI